MEQRIVSNVTGTSMQEALDKPYVAPTLEYTKKRVMPKEAAILQKVGKDFPFNKGYYTKV